MKKKNSWELWCMFVKFESQFSWSEFFIRWFSTNVYLSFSCHRFAEFVLHPNWFRCSYLSAMSDTAWIVRFCAVLYFATHHVSWFHIIESTYSPTAVLSFIHLVLDLLNETHQFLGGRNKSLQWNRSVNWWGKEPSRGRLMYNLGTFWHDVCVA